MNNSNNNNIYKIKTIEDLRAAKRRLKSQMEITENKYDNSLAGRSFNLFSNFNRTSPSFASSRIENTLKWFGNKASNRFPMGGISKIIISGLIMLVVPMITRKLKNYLEDKFL